MPKKNENPAEEKAEAVAPIAEQPKPDRNKVNMAEAEQAHALAIIAYNTALASDKVDKIDAMRDAEAAIEMAEQDYAEAAQCAVFALCKAEEHPMRKAAELHSFIVIGHKPVREEKILTGFERTDRERPIDLVKLARKCGLPVTWATDVERLNQILTLRVAQKTGASVADLKAISKSYYMSKATGEIEAGGTPTSNNQLVKMLQSIADKLLGPNVIHVNNHDIAYIEAAHTKPGRKRISISTAQHNFMHRLILDVLHRCVSSKVYEVEYKKYPD